MIAFLTLANLFSAGRLVGAIITVNKLFADNALALLATGTTVWVTNVIAFGLCCSGFVAGRSRTAGSSGSSPPRSGLLRRRGRYPRCG